MLIALSSQSISQILRSSACKPKTCLKQGEKKLNNPSSHFVVVRRSKRADPKTNHEWKLRGIIISFINILN